MLTFRLNAVPTLTRPETDEDLLHAELLRLDTPGGLAGGHFLTDFVLETFRRPNKEYLGAPKVGLPEPTDLPAATLADCLRRRRSTRKFAPEPIPLAQVSALLHLALREFEPNPSNILGRRPFASGGGLYPLETFILARSVEGLPMGAYHYDPQGHHLDQVRPLEELDFNDYFFDSDRYEGMLVHASAAIVLACNAEKVYYKYGQRAWKLILQDSGHMGQNLYLGAAALPPLGICGLGACAQASLVELLRLDGVSEFVVYPFVLGPSAEG